MRQVPINRARTEICAKLFLILIQNTWEANFYVSIIVNYEKDGAKLLAVNTCLDIQKVLNKGGLQRAS